MPRWAWAPLASIPGSILSNVQRERRESAAEVTKNGNVELHLQTVVHAAGTGDLQAGEGDAPIPQRAGDEDRSVRPPSPCVRRADGLTRGRAPVRDLAGAAQPLQRVGERLEGFVLIENEEDLQQAR